MEENSIKLTERQINFLKIYYQVDDSDKAVDMLIEEMVLIGSDPYEMSSYVELMIIRASN